MKKKRSLSLHGHKTSIALEPEFWDVIDIIAQKKEQSVAGLLAELDDQRISDGNRSGLASYLRVWTLKQVLKSNSISET